MAGFSIDRFVHDTEAPHAFGRPRPPPPTPDPAAFFLPTTEPTAPKATRTHTSPDWPPPSPSSASTSTALTRADTGSSRATTISEATSLSTAPSTGPNPPPPTLDQQLLSMPLPNDYDGPTHPCIFHGILKCHFGGRGSSGSGLRGFAAWSAHHIAHFGAQGPPSHALCVFCDAAFDYPAGAAAGCWAAYLAHVFAHLERGRRLRDRRPDFGVLRDLCEKGVLGASDYEHLCTGSERPAVGGMGAGGARLMPLDWEPEEVVARRAAEEAAANCVAVAEPRRERRERRRRPRATGGKTHSPRVVQ